MTFVAQCLGTLQTLKKLVVVINIFSTIAINGNRLKIIFPLVCLVICVLILF